MKKITLGITGAIGASNVDNYAVLLSQKYEVNIIMTANAKNFVGLETLKYYSNSICYDLFHSKEVNHVKLGQECDVFIIMPASANSIGKIANGVADDLLTSSVLNYSGKILFAPNMNQTMWKNPILQDNVKYLKEKGHIFVNRTKKGIEAYDNSIVDIDCALPNPKDLFKYISELT